MATVFILACPKCGFCFDADNKVVEIGQGEGSMSALWCNIVCPNCQYEQDIDE